MPYATGLIYLPEFYNSTGNGVRKKVEEEKFELTAEEICYDVLNFGGGTWYPGTIGVWWDKAQKYADEIRIFETDFPDTQSNMISLQVYVKNTLIPRFQQKAIHLKIVPNLTVVDVWVS